MTNPSDVKVTEDLDDRLRTARTEFQAVSDKISGTTTPTDGVDPSTITALEAAKKKATDTLDKGSKAAEAARKHIGEQKDLSEETEVKQKDTDAEKIKTAVSGDHGAGTQSPTSQSPAQQATNAAQQAVQQAASAPQQVAQPFQQAAQQMAQIPQQVQQQQTQARQAAAGVQQAQGNNGYGGVSRDEIRQMVQQALAGQSGRGAPDSSGSKTTSERGEGGKLAPTGAEKIDPSQVTFEKTGTKMSPDEVASVVMDAADLLGIPSDDETRTKWINLMTPMTMAEAGGNADAANGWDSNAHGEQQSDGFPFNSSRGPWQTIPTTFAAYHVGGTSTSIYDPTASAAAAMNYIMDRYDVGSDASNIESFASDRGIDISTGKQVGSYKGY